MRFVLALLLALSFVTPVWAQKSIDDFVKSCSKVADLPLAAGSEADNRGVNKNDVLCFEFDSGFGTGGSKRFVVDSAASLCLDPDRNASGTSGAAIVDVEWCGVDGAVNNACLATGLTLTGANPCEAILTGFWRFNVTTAPIGTEDAVIVIRGY